MHNTSFEVKDEMISSADFFRQTAQKHIWQEFVDTATCDT